MPYTLTDAQAQRPLIRVYLTRIQGGRCAMCGEPAPRVGDHDHDTGFVRGLLCTPCNNRAKRGTADPVALAYIANPPAAGFNWLWDLPDWWEPSDSDVCNTEGVAIVDYILARPGEAQRRQEARMRQAIAALQTVHLPTLDSER